MSIEACPLSTMHHGGGDSKAKQRSIARHALEDSLSKQVPPGRSEGSWTTWRCEHAEHCSEIRANKRSLLSHILSTHRTDIAYTCQLCSKTYGTKHNRDKHQRACTGPATQPANTSVVAWSIAPRSEMINPRLQLPPDLNGLCWYCGGIFECLCDPQAIPTADTVPIDLAGPTLSPGPTLSDLPDSFFSPM